MVQLGLNSTSAYAGEDAMDRELHLSDQGGWGMGAMHNWLRESSDQTSARYHSSLSGHSRNGISSREKKRAVFIPTLSKPIRATMEPPGGDESDRCWSFCFLPSVYFLF